MFEHPQLAALRQRKWDLIAKSASLRDDLMVEGASLERLSKWVDLGISVSRLLKNNSRWLLPLLGAAAIPLFRSSLFSKLRETCHHVHQHSDSLLHRIAHWTKNLLIGWQTARRIQSLWHPRCPS